jgi:hypothetical protein
MTRPDRVASDDKASLDPILASPPEFATVAARVRAFAAITNERRGRRPRAWTTAANSGLV